MPVSLSVSMSLCLYVCRAADEYIVRHFDRYIRGSAKSQSAFSVLRVYDPARRIGTVSETVRRYCLLDADCSRFVAPTRNDVMRHGVIVTTLVTSLMLTRLGFKGHFTHIFVDEAAQV